MPDPLDLDRLEALEKAATPGPWATDFQLLYFLTVGDCCLAATIRNALPQLLAMARRCEAAERTARVLEAQLAERQAHAAKLTEELADARKGAEIAVALVRAELAELKATAIRAEREMAGIIETKKRELAEAVRLLGLSGNYWQPQAVKDFLAKHKET